MPVTSSNQQGARQWGCDVKQGCVGHPHWPIRAPRDCAHSVAPGTWRLWHRSARMWTALNTHQSGHRQGFIPWLRTFLHRLSQVRNGR